VKILIMLLSILLPDTAFGQRTIPAPNKWIVSAEASTNYWHEVVAPILTRHQTDPKELASVRNRLDDLALSVTNKTLMFQMIGAYAGNLSAKVDYSIDSKLLNILVFVPRIRDNQRTLSPDVFENLLVLTFAHEMMHVEHLRSGQFGSIESRRGKPYGPLEMKDEAAAWGKTILEIVRPWIAQGKRLPENFRHNSEQLKLVKDDYSDPRWVLVFKDPPF
jgi:hypothetical protein